jgi:putative N6-adenine-specific DNA methylase
MRLPKLIGLKPARRIPLYNGALECRLYVFDMVAGFMRGRSR